METINKNDLVDKALQKLKAKRKGAKVFCVRCIATNKLLRKWHNSYLCTDCYKIMKNVGEEQFIKALKGEEE